MYLDGKACDCKSESGSVISGGWCVSQIFQNSIRVSSEGVAVDMRGYVNGHVLNYFGATLIR